MFTSLSILLLYQKNAHKWLKYAICEHFHQRKIQGNALDFVYNLNAALGAAFFLLGVQSMVCGGLLLRILKPPAR